MNYVIAYVAVLLIFITVDLVWLGGVAKRFYRAQLGDLLAETFNFPAAAAFYLMYPLGVVNFVVAPAMSSGSLADTCIWGAALGFFAYATYDLTNLATLRTWPVRLAVVDMLWGSVLTALAAAGGYLIAYNLSPG